VCYFQTTSISRVTSQFIYSIIPRMRPSSPPVTKVGVNKPTGRGRVTLNNVATNLYTANRHNCRRVVWEKDSVPKRYFNITKEPCPIERMKMRENRDKN